MPRAAVENLKHCSARAPPEVGLAVANSHSQQQRAQPRSRRDENLFAQRAMTSYRRSFERNTFAPGKRHLDSTFTARSPPTDSRALRNEPASAEA